MFGNILTWVVENKKHLATASLVVGFFVDIITFTNIDLSISLLILSVHLTIVAGSILILAIPSRETKTFFAKVREWIPIIQQYSMGSLLSAFLILYSASGSVTASWPFLLLVGCAVLANESVRLEKYHLPFQTTLFFLNLLLFSALAVPIAMNEIGTRMFSLSALVALMVFGLFVRFGRVISRGEFRAEWPLIRLGWVLMTGIVVAFYFTNVIPPIPLSVKVAGVYYSVERTGGEYHALREPRPWVERFLDLNGETLYLTQGARAYAFTAVFAPAHFSERIVHRWQYFNRETEVWETRNTVGFPIVGGRHGGYRGYSFTDVPDIGRWRVSVETEGGQVIGRTYFSVERVAGEVATELYTL